MTSIPRTPRQASFFQEDIYTPTSCRFVSKYAYYKVASPPPRVSWHDYSASNAELLYVELGSLEYFFIAISPKSTLTWRGRTC